MIKLNIIGHLGKDCTVNTVNQKSVINFSVCHTEKYKDSQGIQKERSIWIDCSWWSDKTLIAQYLKKGTLVYVDGTPDVRAYVNNQGIPYGIITLRVSAIQLLGGNNNVNNNTPAPVQNNNSNYSNPVASLSINNNIEEPPIDDLPF